jgi:hypothetical protein
MRVAGFAIVAVLSQGLPESLAAQQTDLRVSMWTNRSGPWRGRRRTGAF